MRSMRPDRDVRVRRIRVPTEHGGMPALVLSPPAAPKDAAGVLWLHGGGYIAGMKEMVHMSRAVDLVKRYGAVVLSPGYRLAPWVSWPAAMEDCYAALLYLKEQAAALTPYAAPVRLEDFSGLPPAYSFVGDGEPFYAETVHYFERLRAAGVPAQLDVYHCDMHAFDMMRPQDARSVEAAETFNRQFAYARAHYFAPQREADDGEGRVR